MKLAGFWNMYKDPQAREHFVKTTRANHELRELAGQYKAASGKDKDALKEKIVKAVGVVFDLDVSQKELQIKRMQDEIASLKGKVAKRLQLKDKYVSSAWSSSPGKAKTGSGRRRAAGRRLRPPAGSRAALPRIVSPILPFSGP